MSDIFIGSIEHLAITMAAKEPPRPLVRMSHQEFVAGYAAGLREGMAGEHAGIPMTDEELMSSLIIIFLENPETAEQEKSEQWYAVGSLVGLLSAARY